MYGNLAHHSVFDSFGIQNMKNRNFIAAVADPNPSLAVETERSRTVYPITLIKNRQYIVHLDVQYVNSVVLVIRDVNKLTLRIIASNATRMKVGG